MELRSYRFNCQCWLCQLKSSESSAVSHRCVELLEKFNTTIFSHLELRISGRNVSDHSLLNDFTHLITELCSLRRKNQNLDFPSIQLQYYLTELLHLLGKHAKEAKECFQLYHFYLQHNAVFSCKMAYELVIFSATEALQDVDWCAMWFAKLKRLLYIEDKKRNYEEV